MPYANAALRPYVVAESSAADMCSTSVGSRPPPPNVQTTEGALRVLVAGEPLVRAVLAYLCARLDDCDAAARKAGLAGGGSGSGGGSGRRVPGTGARRSSLLGVSWNASDGYWEAVHVEPAGEARAQGGGRPLGQFPDEVSAALAHDYEARLVGAPLNFQSAADVTAYRAAARAAAAAREMAAVRARTPSGGPLAAAVPSEGVAAASSSPRTLTMQLEALLLHMDLLHMDAPSSGTSVGEVCASSGPAAAAGGCYLCVAQPGICWRLSPRMDARDESLSSVATGSR